MVSETDVLSFRYFSVESSTCGDNFMVSTRILVYLTTHFFSSVVNEHVA
jgi:hypothetical protein